MLQGQSKNKCESVISEGVGSESVKNECVMDVESEEMLAQRQEEMEQAAMAGLSECVACHVCVCQCVCLHACLCVILCAWLCAYVQAYMYICACV